MNCPECGIPENMKIISADEPDEHGFVSLVGVKRPLEFVYSCEHYQDVCQHPRCVICGKRDAPVCQVPVSIPFSDAYCADNPVCVEALRVRLYPIQLNAEFFFAMQDSAAEKKEIR